jgi:threonine aldolase
VTSVLVDLRSDTVTRPTPDMRRAMADAEVGDDQYGEDPTVRRLEEEAAAALGKQAALFVPSGTMGNQIALLTQTTPGTGVVAGARSHLVLFEAGAGAANAGVLFLTEDDRDGMLPPEGLSLRLSGPAHHQPPVGLVAIEDSHMASGGRVWPPTERRRVAELASAAGVPVHLDGARIWNAAVATGRTPAEVAAGADTVMACLSKGLGAPVGSVLAGQQELINRARTARHRLGGAMRQAGVLAAAGLVGLRRLQDRLVEDHRRAARLAMAIAERWPDAWEGGSTTTNVVVFRHGHTDRLLAHLRDQGVLAGTIAPGWVRLVTHLDVDDEGIDRACRALASAP